MVEAYDRASPTYYQGQVALCGWSIVCPWLGAYGSSQEADVPKARLTNASGLPVADRTIRFDGPDGRSCSGVTNTRGEAWCVWRHSEDGLGKTASYTASFDGDDRYAPDSDMARLSGTPTVCYVHNNDWSTPICAPRSVR